VGGKAYHWYALTTQSQRNAIAITPGCAPLLRKCNGKLPTLSSVSILKSLDETQWIFKRSDGKSNVLTDRSRSRT
jgi:hypothetical protein